MSSFVLVHGGWEGGWCWSALARLLREQGYEVYCPTLTGLGERAHLISRNVDLETHIADVLGVLRYEDLRNVTLVGHSYGGMVITGVADRAAERIGALIYLDAFLPENGQSLFDLTLPERRAMFEKRAAEGGEGWKIPPLPSVAWHVTDSTHAALLESRSVAHPLATMAQKLSLSGNHLKVPKKCYVLATGYSPSAFPRFAARARELGWPVEELPTHHFTMLSMPGETAEILVRHAA
jgi:pimeloyl-ACP methyl ester carboxylesterase